MTIQINTNSLDSTYFMNSDHEMIQKLVHELTNPKRSILENVNSIYYFVRDEIKYDPYSLSSNKEFFQASHTLQRKRGYCVAKALLLAALCRAIKIPAKIGLADVKNHINSKKLQALMETNVFYYHGYTDIFLNEKWIKSTPAFDQNLCKLVNIKPLEFDPEHDSIFHPFDKNGNQHMEYLHYHGSFDELPFEMMTEGYKKQYPKFMIFVDKLAKRNFDKELLE